MKRQLIILACIGMLAIYGTGCAAVKGAVASVRTAVNKSLDVVDKAVDTGGKLADGAVSGAASTVTPVVAPQ